MRRAGQLVLILGAVLVGAAVARHTGAATAPVVAIDLGTLGGDFSFAYDVNARGQVVGDSFTTGNRADHAFSWTPAGGLIDLGGRDSSTFAVAVNARGQVVGYSTGGAADHAFSWTPAGGVIDLGTLGGNFS
jgi:probable HAF family extracellular repeat protein